MNRRTFIEALHWLTKNIGRTFFFIFISIINGLNQFSFTLIVKTYKYEEKKVKFMTNTSFVLGFTFPLDLRLKTRSIDVTSTKTHMMVLHVNNVRHEESK